jgi:hypothetical protein
MFAEGALVTSWSCRTGIGSRKEIFKNIEEAKCDESLAQLIANATWATVKAFLRRSQYEDTYGEQTIFGKLGRKLDNRVEDLEKYKAEEKKYENDLKKYETDAAAYRRKLEAYRQTEGNADAKSVPGIPPPKTPKPPKEHGLSKEDEAWAKERIEEKRIQEECHLPIKLDGALLPVKTGKTPIRLPEGMRTFTRQLPKPKEEAKK